MFRTNTPRVGVALASFVALVLASGTAAAQQRIRGQIEKIDGSVLALKTRDGAMMNVKVADDARVSALIKAAAADIKPDTFIGIAGIPQPDGSIQRFQFIFSCRPRAATAKVSGPGTQSPAAP